MTTAACRVCGRECLPGPLLSFAGMPKAAQGFPDADGLGEDEGADLQVLQCAACGLVQLAGEPVPYHRDVIRAAAVSDVVLAANHRQFAAFVDRYGLTGARVLEVGCGRGEFLSVLAGLDVQAFGLEHDADAVAACTAEGLRVTQGYPGEAPRRLLGAPFDAFLLLMFLEHMPEPGAALRAIAAELAPGAVGLVEVPNLDMVLRRALFSEFIADHLLYFTAATLRTTLELNGFEVLETAETRDDYVLSAVVRKRCALDLAAFSAARDKLTAGLHAFLDHFPAGAVAVWGAGHQALAVIALTGSAARIRYVVDSAPFKQGRFTPATHLPVVAPEALTSDPVEAVVVMAASYSDEVVGILRERFDPDLRVAVVRESGLVVLPQAER